MNSPLDSFKIYRNSFRKNINRLLQSLQNVFHFTVIHILDYSSIYYNIYKSKTEIQISKKIIIFFFYEG
jgi:hypothetical protein